VPVARRYAGPAHLDLANAISRQFEAVLVADLHFDVHQRVAGGTDLLAGHFGRREGNAECFGHPEGLRQHESLRGPGLEQVQWHGRRTYACDLERRKRCSGELVPLAHPLVGRRHSDRVRDLQSWIREQREALARIESSHHQHGAAIVERRHRQCVQAGRVEQR
jgi:hypothetical protein